MLPAFTFAEITANLAALHLEPSTAAQILAAMFAPLLRSADPDPPTAAPDLPRQRPERLRWRRSRRAQPKHKKPKRRRVVARGSADGPRQRAARALAANPDATPTEIAKIAKVSRSTVVHAREALDAEARKAARETLKPAKSTERRQRAQQFLREQLARGAKQASAVEDAAARARIDEQALGQARVDLGIITSRANTGGPQAVQWSLPG